jgi:hypothetical protein
VLHSLRLIQHVNGPVNQSVNQSIKHLGIAHSSYERVTLLELENLRAFRYFLLNAMRYSVSKIAMQLMASRHRFFKVPVLQSGVPRA